MKGSRSPWEGEAGHGDFEMVSVDGADDGEDFRMVVTDTTEGSEVWKLETDLRRVEQMVTQRMERSVAGLRATVTSLESRVGDLESVFEAQWSLLRRIELEGLSIRKQVRRVDPDDRVYGTRADIAGSAKTGQEGQSRR